MHTEGNSSALLINILEDEAIRDSGTSGIVINSDAVCGSRSPTRIIRFTSNCECLEISKDTREYYTLEITTVSSVVLAAFEKCT